MHNFIKKGFVIISLSIIFYSTGCSLMKDTDTKVTEEVEELETELKDDLDTMEAEANEDINKKDSIEREDINEAATYIKEHIKDPFESEDVTKKLYYYSSFIISAANNKGVNVDNDLYTLATDTKQYIRNIYREENDKNDEAMTTLRTSIDDIANRLDKEKDELVDKFYNLVK